MNEDVKETTEQKADDLIEQYKKKVKREIGSVVNGDPEFYYVHVGNNSPDNMTVQRLIDRGYELETDPKVHKFGFIGGVLYKIPKKYAEHLLNERHAKFRQSPRRRMQ